jgi:hypothetical protein
MFQTVIRRSIARGKCVHRETPGLVDCAGDRAPTQSGLRRNERKLDEARLRR